MNFAPSALPPNDQETSDFEAALAKVCVRRPYVSFDRLSLPAAGSLRATVTRQMECRLERTPVRAAEAARHMAILGLFAASTTAPRPGRFVYLAESGRLSMTPAGRIPTRTDSFVVDATATWSGHRTVQATASIAEWGQPPCFEAEISYQVVSERLVARMAGVDALGHDEARGWTDAHRQPPPVRAVPSPDLGPLGIAAELGPIEASWCLGHFPLAPTMPVAMVLAACVRGGELLGEKVLGKTSPYRILSAEMTALALPVPGDVLALEVRGVQGEATNQLSCRVTNRTRDMAPVAQVTSEIEIVGG